MLPTRQIKPEALADIKYGIDGPDGFLSEREVQKKDAKDYSMP